MSQDRLSALSIMCTENDKLRQANCDELLDDLAIRKARKTLFKF